MVLSHTLEPVGVGCPNPRARQPSPYDCVLLRRDTPSGSLVGSGVCPRIADDGDHCSLRSDEDERLTAGDGDISGITCASDQLEFAVIGDDNCMRGYLHLLRVPTGR